MPNFAQARWNMVENQLRPSHIDSPEILSAMGSTAREAFLPAHLRGVAYGDDDIALGAGKFLIEPLALAKLLQAAEIKPDDVALIIGCSTGYAAAVTAKLAATVFQLLADEKDVEPVDAILSELECDNVVVEPGAHLTGLPSQAPFDVVIVVGAVAEVAAGWRDQLAEGGRLVFVQRRGGFGKVTIMTKRRGTFSEACPFDASTPNLADAPQSQGFVF